MDSVKLPQPSSKQIAEALMKFIAPALVKQGKPASPRSKEDQAS